MLLVLPGLGLHPLVGLPPGVKVLEPEDVGDLGAVSDEQKLANVQTQSEKLQKILDIKKVRKSLSVYLGDGRFGQCMSQF